MTGIESNVGRITVRLAVVGASLALVACARSTPAPVEDREVETRVRAPAQQESAGVQVYPLQNPAVEGLTAEATRAEQSGDFERAAVLLERAMRIQPRDPELLQHMAEIQLHRKDYAQALSFAARSYDAGPRVGEICARNWRTISVSRERMGDDPGALSARQRAEECMVTRPPGL